ncbi:DUF2913 domain-containing protein [Photobacterium sanctipauli]|uniref:DUF2913 domain-containing protein n=1 Tax=Photobacterium sanctipauli TaxID=1342794 RepID=A0A2T3NWZ0_9GAMM|nr:DUF2913 family protein [Photobacterium sanctipauli]PSW20785.1 DUF2913 domain-containing protein [Photobacterium sanctipauli]
MSQSQLQLDVCTLALLHLEFKKLDKPLSLAERNNLLIQFLKPKIKANHYRAIKKSTKKWVMMGRQPGADLESVLEQEQERLQAVCSTDMYRFVDLIGEIEQLLRTKVQYSVAREIDLNARYGKVLVTVVDEDLTASFDDDGLMIKSTQILFIGNSEHKEIFSAAIEKDNNFQSVVAYEDDNHLRVELFRL